MPCKRPFIESSILNQRVVIQTRTLSTSGEPSQTWATISQGASVPAQVLGVGGGERKRGQQIEAGVTTMVTMRFRTDIDPTMRIVHDGRSLNIVRVYDPDGSRVSLVCQCKETA